jgi:hypothetical protein
MHNVVRQNSLSLRNTRAFADEMLWCAGSALKISAGKEEGEIKAEEMKQDISIIIEAKLIIWLIIKTLS